MPDIYTTEWYDELKDLLNRNPDMEKSAPKGPLKVLGQFLGDGPSPYLAEGDRQFFVVLLDDGTCTDYYEVAEPPPRKEFDFIFDIPASVFEEVAAGVTDPVAAGLKGTIKLTGDMRILIRHADLVNVVQDVYAREVETTWPKGKPPYPSP
jgi:putative sterol carrier protein